MAAPQGCFAAATVVDVMVASACGCEPDESCSVCIENEREDEPWPELRTYADHLRAWENARLSIAEARELSVPALKAWLHKHGGDLLDATENLLDATAFKDRDALRRQTEIVQRIGGNLD